MRIIALFYGINRDIVANYFKILAQFDPLWQLKSSLAEENSRESIGVQKYLN